MTSRMPVFCWKEFLQLKSLKVLRRRLEVVFLNFFTEIPHWDTTVSKTHKVSALKEPVED